MSSDQIAEIRPAVREAIDGAPDTCVTFEVEDASNLWLQFADHTVNAAYPHADDPKERMRSLLGSIDARIVSWEAGKFVTVEFSEVELTRFCEWIDQYFVSELGCAAGEYHIDSTFHKI